MEAYRVSTRLDLDDLVGSRIAALIRQFDVLERKTKATTAALHTIGRVSSDVQRTTGALTGMNAELQRAVASAGLFEKELKGLRSTPPGLARVASGVDRIDTSLLAASRSAAALRGHLRGLNVPGVPLTGRAGGSGANYGGVHGGNLHMGPAGLGIGAVGLGMGGAAVPLIAGYLGYRGVKAAAHEAGEYQREQAAFRLFGMTEQQNEAAKRIAETMKVPGTSMIERFRYVSEAQGIFRESGMEGVNALDAARQVAPLLARVNYAATTLMGKELTRAQELDFSRAVEMLGGLQSPKKMHDLAEWMFKVWTTSGGTVDPSQLRQAIRTGGSAVKSLSYDALFGFAEPLMGEMKGGPFGTAMNTAYKRINGLIKLPNQALHEMLRLGLWDRDAIVLNRMGGLKEVKQGRNPLRWADEYATDPFSFYHNRVVPLYDKAGYTQQQRYRENTLLFGDTGSRLFNLVDTQWGAMKHSHDAVQKTWGLDRAVSEGEKQLTGAERDFHAAWSDFKNVFGDTVLPAVTGTLKVATAFMQSANAFVSHPLDSMWKFMQQYAPDGGGGAVPMPGAAASNSTSSRPSAVPPPSKQTVQVQTQIHLDGRKVGDVVSEHMAKHLGGSFSGGFDPAIGLLPAGLK